MSETAHTPSLEVAPGVPPPPDPAWIRYAPLISGILAVVAIVLRFDGIYDYWINGDEGIYYTIAHADWSQASEAIEGNAHPPLFYLLMRFVAVFSAEHTALRLPSLVAGGASVYLVFVLTRRVAGTAAGPTQSAVAGLVAALLLTFAPSAITLSQVARPYMSQCALLLGALVFLWRHAETGRTRDLVGYAVMMVLALLWHYSTMLILGALGLAHVLALVCRAIPRQRLKPLLLAQIPLLAVIAYSVSTHVARGLMGGQLQDQAQVGWLRTFFLDHALDAWPAFLGLCDYLTGGALIVAPAVLVLLGIAVCLRVPGPRFFAVFAVMTLGAAVGFSILRLYPFGGHRHSFYLVVVLVPLIAVGIVRVMAAGRVAGLGLTTTLLAIAIADPYLAPWIGDDAERGELHRELDIGMDQVDEFAKVLRLLHGTPGIVIADMQTASSLAPFLRGPLHSLQWSAEGIAYQQFGKRTLVLSNAWTMEAGAVDVRQKFHLGYLLAALPRALPPDLLRLGADDVRLLSCQGARLPNRIFEFGNSLKEPTYLFHRDTYYWRETYTCTQLDVKAFLAACDEIARRG